MLFFCLLGAAVGVLGWRYARAVRRFDSDDRRLAQYIDERTPGLEQRLITSMDSWEKQRTDSPSQLVESLWLDTVAHVRGRNIQQVAGSRPAWYRCRHSLCAGLSSGRRTLGFDPIFRGGTAGGLALVDPGCGFTAIGRFRVAPGDILIRRGSDVAVTATIENVSSKNVFLYLREKRIRMEARPDAGRRSNN